MAPSHERWSLSVSMARAWLAAVGRGSRGARGTVGLAVGRRLSAAAAANGWMPPREDKDAMKSRLAQAQKAAAAPPQLAGVKPRPVQSAAVIGSGTMGAGIAMCFAEAGIPVALHDTSQEALDRALASMRKTWESAAKKERISPQDALDFSARVSAETRLDNDSMRATDLVVEAVFENMAVKKGVFAELDKVCKESATLATNTSTLNVDEIFADVRNKHMAVGMHFFSPANVMPLLENIKGAHSSPETLATAMALGVKLRKVPVLAGNCFGFIGNRMFEVYAREAMFLLEEGALPHQIDAALAAWGMAMGPLAVGDLAGLDIGYSIRKEQGLTDPKTRPADTGRYGGTVPDKLVLLGRSGQKTKKGFYDYSAGRTPERDPSVEDLIIQTSKELGITRREISEQEIIERCVFGLINEGFKIVDDGIAAATSDIDVVYAAGCELPPAVAPVPIPPFRPADSDTLWRLQISGTARGSDSRCSLPTRLARSKCWKACENTRK